MNTEYITNQKFKDSSFFQEFLLNNPGKGNLKIRTFAANEAIPISDVNIIVSTVYDNTKIVFFDGSTDSSGMIDVLSLPTPKLLLDNMEKPNSIIYEVDAIYKNNSVNQKFSVLMYDGVCVLQNINILPDWGNS